MRFHPLVQNSTHYFSWLKWVYATQTLTSTEHHISSLHSHFWVQLSAGSPFLPTDKNGKFLRFLSNIRECGSTLYVGLEHAVPPTNTKFKPLLLMTRAGMPYTNTHKQRMSYFMSTLTFMGPENCWKSILPPYKKKKKKEEILAVLHHQNNNINIK